MDISRRASGCVRWHAATRWWSTSARASRCSARTGALKEESVGSFQLAGPVAEVEVARGPDAGPGRPAGGSPAGRFAASRSSTVRPGDRGFPQPGSSAWVHRAGVYRLWPRHPSRPLTYTGPGRRWRHRGAGAWTIVPGMRVATVLEERTVTARAGPSRKRFRPLRSGKKYKRCHGAPTSAAPERSAAGPYASGLGTPLRMPSRKGCHCSPGCHCVEDPARLGRLASRSRLSAVLRHPDRAGSGPDGLGGLLGGEPHHDPQDENLALLVRSMSSSLFICSAIHPATPAAPDRLLVPGNRGSPDGSSDLRAADRWESATLCAANAVHEGKKRPALVSR